MPPARRLQPSRSGLLVLACIIAAQGCYSYVPTRVETVQPGEAVRIRITQEEAERLEPVRLSDLRVMDAVMVRPERDEWLVETTVGRLDPQRGTRPLVQRVSLPLGEILEVEARRRDNLKTGAAVGAAGVAVGFGIAAALRGGFGQRSNEGEGPAEDRWFPIVLRLALPF